MLAEYKANRRGSGRMGLGPCAFFIVACATVCLPPAAGSQTLDHPYSVELRLECDQKDIRLGDEILITFVFTNKDPNIFMVSDPKYDRSGRIYEYELAAKHFDGTLVPDPREQPFPALGGGFASGGPAPIQTGSSFRKSIPLNLWSRITEPGRYFVTGTYHYWVEDKSRKPRKGFGRSKGIQLISVPIQIEVKPRSRSEMGTYIAEVTARWKSLQRDGDYGIQQEREHLVSRLAYTCDTRIIPTMLDLIYKKPGGNGTFHACEAFWGYLPHTQEVKDAVMTAIKTRGFSEHWTALFYHPDFAAERTQFIRQSLASRDPNSILAATHLAERYPADEYIPKLIAIATGRGLRTLGLPTGLKRDGAIQAIVQNRTDEGVAALKSLLNDPNAEIRKTTTEAIKRRYYIGPFYPEREDEALTQALVSVAKDPNDPFRSGSIQAIIRSRTRDAAAAINALLADPNADVPLAQTDLGVRTIRDLFSDSDPAIRHATRSWIGTYYKPVGRPLGPDGFPPEFQAAFEQWRQEVTKVLMGQ